MRYKCFLFRSLFGDIKLSSDLQLVCLKKKKQQGRKNGKYRSAPPAFGRRRLWQVPGGPLQAVRVQGAEFVTQTLISTADLLKALMSSEPHGRATQMLFKNDKHFKVTTKVRAAVSRPALQVSVLSGCIVFPLKGLEISVLNPLLSPDGSSPHTQSIFLKQSTGL